MGRASGARRRGCRGRWPDDRNAPGPGRSAFRRPAGAQARTFSARDRRTPSHRKGNRPRTVKKKQPFFEQVAIVGVGLLGASLALALKKRKLAGRIVGVGRSDE